MTDLNLPFGIGAGFPVDDDPSSGDLWLRWAPDQLCPIRIVSPQVYHYRGHWYAAARTFRLCTAPAGHPRPVGCCRFCPEGHRPGDKPKAAPAEWRFFLAVQMEDGQQRIWEFSKPVAEQVARQVAANGGAWAGLTLRLSRAGQTPRGAVQVAADPEPPSLGPLPTDVLDAPSFLAQTWTRAALKDGKSAGAEMSLTVQEILFSPPAPVPPASAPSPPASASSSAPASAKAAADWLRAKGQK